MVDFEQKVVKKFVKLFFLSLEKQYLSQLYNEVNGEKNLYRTKIKQNTIVMTNKNHFVFDSMIDMEK
jgi:hypothetical protein